MEDKVLESVVENLGYDLVKDVLVKPLPKVMITKEVSEAIGTGEKDVDGYEKFETKTETKEVESEFNKGVVLAMPEGDYRFKLGDIVVYVAKFAKDFDLFKDSQLVKPYDIIAISK